MIQFEQKPVVTIRSVRANLYDTMTNDEEYNPLIVYKSQFTGYTKNSIGTVPYWASKERYVSFQQTILAPGETEDLSAGKILFGTKDFPFGFYDVTIYQNSSNSNLDPSGLTTTLYTGLLNLISSTDTTQYKQYTTNDTDTDSVYITL